MDESSRDGSIEERVIYVLLQWGILAAVDGHVSILCQHALRAVCAQSFSEFLKPFRNDASYPLRPRPEAAWTRFLTDYWPNIAEHCRKAAACINPRWRKPFTPQEDNAGESDRWHRIPRGGAWPSRQEI